MRSERETPVRASAAPTGMQNRLEVPPDLQRRIAGPRAVRRSASNSSHLTTSTSGLTCNFLTQPTHLDLTSAWRDGL